MNDDAPYEGYVEVGSDMRPDHAKYFDEALQIAVDKLPEHVTGPLDVTYEITVRHTSPGWIDGYRVVLKPKP